MAIPPVQPEHFLPDGFWVSTLSGGIVGLATSFFASLFFIHSNNKNHKPVMKISPQLIKAKRDDGTPALIIKVINQTDQDIADVIFEVEGVKNKAPIGSIPLLDLTMLGKRNVLYIKKYSKDDQQYHYAHRVYLYKENSDILSEMSNFEQIRVSIRATCPYYGTSVITSQDYIIPTQILDENYSFNTGDSLDASSH